MQHDTVDPKLFATSTRALLDEDWRRYRNFGMYWYFVKALLRRHFDKNEMPSLGDYEDASVNERIPAGNRGSLNAMLAAAIAEYAENAAHNLLRNAVMDDDGEFFTLLDPDIEG